MTAGKLISLLRNYPPEMEIHMEVKGLVGIPTDIDWETGGASAWLTITDYPIPEKKNESK